MTGRRSPDRNLRNRCGGLAARIGVAGIRGAMIYLLAAGCAHEQTTWPPSASEVARINNAAADNHWFRIEYVTPIPSPDLRVEQPTRIESLGSSEIVFRAIDGQMHQLPRTMVAGVTIKDRARGALVGSGIGSVPAIAELAAWYWLRSGRQSCQEPRGIDGDICSGTLFIGTAAAFILTGAVFGYLIGGRRTFHFVP